MATKVLIISEDEEFLKRSSSFLGLSSFSVTVAISGIDAVEMAKEINPRVVLCSHNLQDLSGEQVLCLLREDQFLRRVIFIGIGDEAALFRKYMDLGADDFLSSTTDLPALLQTVKLKLQLLKSREDKPYAVSQTINTNVDSIAGLSDLATEKINISADEYLFRSGDPARFLYQLRKGSVKTSLLDEKGNELITNLFNEGDFIGFKPLIEDRAYLKDAVAIDDCVLDKIPGAAVFKILAAKPNVAKGLLLSLSKQYTDTEEDLLYIAYSSVRKRLGLKLIQFCEEQNTQSFKIGREDLANILGTSTETVVRALSDLKKQKLITTYGSKITIKSLSGLKSKFQNFV